MYSKEEEDFLRIFPRWFQIGSLDADIPISMNARLEIAPIFR
jgi:hypothetical protein